MRNEIILRHFSRKKEQKHLQIRHTKLHSFSQRLYPILFCFVIFIKGPDNHEIQVQNLRSESFVKGDEINTFKVNFTWEGPSFKHSVAYSYIVTYELLGGYSRDQISCSPFVRDNDGSGCSKSGVVRLKKQYIFSEKISTPLVRKE